jgi:hypothetical protein
MYFAIRKKIEEEEKKKQKQQQQHQPPKKPNNTKQTIWKIPQYGNVVIQNQYVNLGIYRY